MPSLDQTKVATWFRGPGCRGGEYETLIGHSSQHAISPSGPSSADSELFFHLGRWPADIGSEHRSVHRITDPIRTMPALAPCVESGTLALLDLVPPPKPR